jgi:hypothetical protein
LRFKPLSNFVLVQFIPPFFSKHTKERFVIEKTEPKKMTPDVITHFSVFWQYLVHCGGNKVRQSLISRVFAQFLSRFRCCLC